MWAIECAEEVRSELARRTELRQKCVENIKKHAIFLSRDKKIDTGNIIRFSETQASRERAQYWDYLRCML